MYLRATYLWKTSQYSKIQPRTGYEGPGGSRGIALLFLGQRHAPAALTLGRTRYLLCRRLCGPHGQAGRVRKSPHPTGIRSPDRPASNETLYGLSYPGSKVEAILLQAWTDPKGSRRLRLPDFKRLSRPQGHNAAGRITSMKNSNDTIGNRTATFRSASTNCATAYPSQYSTKVYLSILVIYSLKKA